MCDKNYDGEYAELMDGSRREKCDNPNDSIISNNSDSIGGSCFAKSNSNALFDRKSYWCFDYLVNLHIIR